MRYIYATTNMYPSSERAWSNIPPPPGANESERVRIKRVDPKMMIYQVNPLKLELAGVNPRPKGIRRRPR